MESLKTSKEEKPKLRGLSLFSGIGGIEIALEEWVETKAYCEIDPYATAVLKSRMADTTSKRHLDKQSKKHSTEIREPSFSKLTSGNIHPDITKLHGKLGEYDIIFGGFPCQDISNAGKRRGIQGKRSGLWFEMQRLISEIRPRYVFVENVSALLNRGLPEVLASLAEIGYDAIWLTLRASDVGAPHRRERVFILAYPISVTDKQQECGKPQEEGITQIKNWENNCGSGLFGRGNLMESKSWQDNENNTNSTEMGNTKSTGQPGSTNRQEQMQSWGTSAWWRTDPADLEPSSESFVGRVADGVPFRVDRIKCLGNAVVPAQAREAFIRLIKIKKELENENDQ